MCEEITCANSTRLSLRAEAQKWIQKKDEKRVLLKLKKTQLKENEKENEIHGNTMIVRQLNYEHISKLPCVVSIVKHLRPKMHHGSS